MKQKRYTNAQKKFVAAVKKKVKDFFEEYPAPGHEFGHARRVAERANDIALREGARSVFLCELAGWLHDIGRVPERFAKGGKKQSHHEWSYQLLRDWFRDDQLFDALSKKEKLELLYAVRYHWNNMANKYDTAWILRDADKLDALGNIGLKRARDSYGLNEKLWNLGLRFVLEYPHWLRTDTAKKILQTERLVEPILRYYKKFLRERIKKVEL